NFGQVLMGVLGYSFEVTPASWRWVLLVGAVPGLLGLWIYFRVPESVRWLAARQRASTQKTGVDAAPLREVLRPPLLSRTLLGIALGAIPVVGTAANGNWLVPWTDHVAQQQTAGAGGEETPR